MRKHIIYTVIILSGLPVGYFGMELVVGQTDRPKTALELFDNYCVPLIQGELVEAGPELLDLPHLRFETFWVEPRSKVAVIISTKTCTVSDRLQPMLESERMALSSAVNAMVTASFPMLRPDLNHGLDSWDEIQLWIQHPIDDERRWGIWLGRLGQTGEQSSTDLMLLLPQH